MIGFLLWFWVLRLLAEAREEAVLFLARMALSIVRQSSYAKVPAASLFLFSYFSEFHFGALLTPNLRVNGDSNTKGANKSILDACMKILLRIKHQNQFHNTQVRLLCSERDQVASALIKRIDERNALEAFADAVRKLCTKVAWT